MSRRSKNIINGSILIVLIGISILTIYFAGQSLKSNNNIFEFDNDAMQDMRTPPNMLEEENNDKNLEQEDSKNQNSQKEKSRNDRKEENKENRPVPPTSSNSDNSEMTPPQEGETPPNMPDAEDENNREDSRMTPPDGNRGEITPIEEVSSLSIWYYVVFGVEAFTIGITLLIWVLSGFHKRSIKETFQNKDKITILMLAATLITAGLTYIDGILAKNIFKNNTPISVNSQSDKETTASTTSNE